MSAYKGMNRKLKDALITIISAITYDTGSGAEPAFTAVLDNTKDEFKGYPAVRVLPDNLASVTGSNVQKDHTVAMAAIVHWPLQDPTNIESDLYNHMYDITDLLVDTIEHADNSGQLAQIDPTITNWKMDVKRANWTVASGKAGAFLLLNVAIEFCYSKDVF